MIDATEKQYLIYGGLGLLLFVLVYFMLRGNNSNAGNGTVPQPSSSMLSFLQKNTEDANQQALAQSTLAANTLLAYNASKNNLELGLQQIQADVSVNSTNATSAENIATIQANAQTQIAGMQTQASEAQSQSATNIAQSQQMAAEYAAYYAGNAATQQAYYQAWGQSEVANAQQKASSNQSFWGNLGGIFQTIPGLLASFGF